MVDGTKQLKQDKQCVAVGSGIRVVMVVDCAVFVPQRLLAAHNGEMEGESTERVMYKGKNREQKMSL